MDWHTAQIAFMVALFIVLGIGGLVGMYVAYTTMWSDRWTVRRDHSDSS